MSPRVLLKPGRLALFAIGLSLCTLSAGVGPQKGPGVLGEESDIIAAAAQEQATELEDLAKYGPMLQDDVTSVPVYGYGAPDAHRAKNGLVLRANAIAGLLDGKRSVVAIVSLVNVSDKPVRVFRMLDYGCVVFRYTGMERHFGVPVFDKMTRGEKDMMVLEPFHSLSVTFCYAGLLDRHLQPGKTIEFQAQYCPRLIEEGQPPLETLLLSPWTALELE